jgi:hypothetical protein
MLGKIVKKGKGGRKPGDKNWNVEEVKLLLFEGMKEISPCGREMWEATATRYAYSSLEEWMQNGESCKKLHAIGIDESSYLIFV